MVLVWPRSTEPLEGSTVNPWCCKVATLSRLNSTICGRGSCWWGATLETVRLGARLPSPSPHPAGQGWAGLGLPGLGQCCGHLLWGQLGGPDTAHLQLPSGRWGRCVSVQLKVVQGHEDGLQLLGFWGGKSWVGVGGVGVWGRGGASGQLLGVRDGGGAGSLAVSGEHNPAPRWAGNAPDPPRMAHPLCARGRWRGSPSGTPRARPGGLRPPQTSCARGPRPSGGSGGRLSATRSRAASSSHPALGRRERQGWGMRPVGPGTQVSTRQPSTWRGAPGTVRASPVGRGWGRGEAAPSRRAPPAAGQRSTGSRGLG